MGRGGGALDNHMGLPTQGPSSHRLGASARNCLASHLQHRALYQGVAGGDPVPHTLREEALRVVGVHERRQAPRLGRTCPVSASFGSSVAPAMLTTMVPDFKIKRPTNQS